MKKTLILAAAALISASAFAQTVTSANIVGYNKIESVEGLQIVAMQFDNASSNTLDSIFGDQYPLGTRILTYEAGVGYYISTYETTYPAPDYLPVDGWNGSVANVGGAGGFWIQMPSGSSAITNVMNGEVPLDATVTNVVDSGLNLFAYPYPVEVEIQDLGFTPTIGDKIFVYINGTGYVPVSYETTYPAPDYLPVDGWSNPTLKIGVGEGFWYQTSTPTNWIATRPFTP